jgi:hypothetical protein
VKAVNQRKARTWCTSANPLREVALLQHTMDTSHRKLEAGLGRARHRLSLRSFLASRFAKSLRYRVNVAPEYKWLIYHNKVGLLEDKGRWLWFERKRRCCPSFLRAWYLYKWRLGLPRCESDAPNKDTRVTCSAPAVAVLRT